jgi:AcrR family transcriptional regulator
LTRPYVKRARAERETETRDRIVEATIELHDSIGGLGTTVTAIAARAKVSRPTVYRHFPDEHALLVACTGSYLEQHPPPDFTAWATIADPPLRLRHALSELYAFYRRNRSLLARADQEAPTNPVLLDVLSGYVDGLNQMRSVLTDDWAVSDPMLLRATVGHAIAFSSWQSLAVDQDLADGRVVGLMERLVVSVADGPALPPLHG